jgi:hypothetical protein
VTKGDTSAWALEEGLTAHCKINVTCYEMLHRAPALVGPCNHGIETSGSIKGGEFLDCLSYS